MTKKSASGPATAPYADRLLNVHEAAALLGLKPGTLYQWAYERRLPTVKLSGLRGPLRFRLSTLLRFIAKAERPAIGHSSSES